MSNKSFTVLFFLFLLLRLDALAVTLPDSTLHKIDSLFMPWDKPDSPGCAIGIISNDSLIIAKGYGMANLEYGIPITPATIFQIASVSKQFTAYAIVLLARQEKLSLEDDIRKYLPWFPDLGEKITIRQLMNHTSGIRDQWQLLAISGTRLDDVITQEHVIKVLSRQRALNFKPGSNYNYSNSGFTLLAEIVKSVTGTTLRKFADSLIFKPLEMNSTHFQDNYMEIVKDRACSYERNSSGGYSLSNMSISNVGATGVLTNVKDLSKWIINFYAPRTGDQQDIEQLVERARLNDGVVLNYAMGLTSDTFKGWRQYSHGGNLAGYRTYMMVFPDLKMGFVVLSNDADFVANGKTYELAALFVKDTTANPIKREIIPTDSTIAILNDIDSVTDLLGDYISDEGMHLSFDIRQSRLYYHLNGQKFMLVRESKSTFMAFDEPQVTFTFTGKGMDTELEISFEGISRIFKKTVRITSPSTALMQTYTGRYYCPELECYYQIVLKNNRLFLTHNKYNDIMLTLIDENHLVNDTWWMSNLVFIRNKKNVITGFEINSNRVMHLRFNKVE